MSAMLEAEGCAIAVTEEDLLYYHLHHAAKKRRAAERMERGTPEWNLVRQEYHDAIDAAKAKLSNLVAVDYIVSPLIAQMLKGEGL